LWNTGIEANRDIVSKHRKRQTKYVANIYVIQDPKNPESEGKVFLYTFGPKILEKIKACSQKEFPDSVPFNPFDFWKGANFRLKIKNVKGQRNYDSSSFDAPEALSGDDALLEKIWESEYALNDSFLNPKNYKSYDAMEKKFNDVINSGGEEVTPSSSSPRTTKIIENNRVVEEPKLDSNESSSASSKYQDFLNKFKESDSGTDDDENLF
jgi:hypothetical protein